MKLPFISDMDNDEVTFTDLQPNMIKVDLIFWHLARTCRFNGMLNKWYSNAEHSMNCALQASSVEVARFCLIHDFGEYIVGDVLTPVKRVCPDYTQLSDQVQSYMYRHFLGTDKVPDEVHEIDRRMTATEMVRLKGKDIRPHLEKYENIIFHCWDWPEAYFQIRQYFKVLFPTYVLPNIDRHR